MLGTIAKSLGQSQLCELEKFADRVTKFGVNFAVCDAEEELVLLREGGGFESDRELIINSCSAIIKRDSKGKKRKTNQLSLVNNRFLGSELKSHSKTIGAALIDLGEKMVRGDNGGRKQKETYALKEVLGEMLGLLAEDFEAVAKAEEQIDMVSTELSQVYEELVLLHKLSTNMKVTESDINFLQIACDSLTDIVNVEGIAVLLEKNVDGEKRLVLAAGSGLIDINEQETANLRDRLVHEIKNGKDALLDSEVDSPFRYEWSNNIRNIIAVPLFGKGKRGTHFAERGQDDSRLIGLMVAINRVDKPDFDSTDVKLFNSVANGCAVFVENSRLFNDLKELFIGSLKALTSSIDAKDPYTRGHSERVAFISRWIATRLATEGLLEEEQVPVVYLTGLLHDIGKMGVSEAVLRKKGRLTEQEFEQMKTHPSIGAGILGGMKQMHDIVPGILSHHERVDGTGYPDGLAGGQIPLIGKIVGLADSFDAMTSKRTYRSAMSVEQALAEIAKGLGKQFDAKVGKIFIGSDVYQLWDIMQDGFSEIRDNINFSEYGTVAVGALIE